MTSEADWIEFATAALSVWLIAFERAAGRPGPMQREHARAAAAAVSAAHALAAGTPLGACFRASLTIARSRDDEEFFERSRCWELRIDGDRLEARSWVNFADQVGASQFPEISVAGAPSDPLPAGAGEWWTSLSAALESPDCFVQASR